MPKIKIFKDFTGGLNTNTTEDIADNDLVIAKNVFYNSAKQLQTRRGVRTFGSQIGASPITSYFFYKKTNTNAKVAICHSGNNIYSYDGSTRNSVASNISEYETLPGLTDKRIRQDYTVFNNVVYINDGVNIYSKFDGTTYSNIGVGSSNTVTVDNTTDTFTDVAHGLAVNNEIYFTSSGTVPGGVTAYQVYYVQSIPTADTFKISTSPTGTALDITTNGTGTISYYKLTYLRQRYGMIQNNVYWTAGDIVTPSTLYYSDPIAGLSNLDINNKYPIIIGDHEDGIINGLNSYAQGSLSFKSGRIYYSSLASGSPVTTPIDSQTGGYSDRSINIVGNTMVYYNERGLDSLAKRTGVDGSGAIESLSLSAKVRETMDAIKPKSYNSCCGYYSKELNNFYLSIDTDGDDIPDTTMVYSSLTGGWTSYEIGNIYDYGEYEDTDGFKQQLFASGSGGQMFEFEYGFDDNGQPFEAEIKTKALDFGDPIQVKTFQFIDVIGWKRLGGEIEITAEVEGEQVAQGFVTDTNINTDASPQGIGVTPIGTSTIGGGEGAELYPFTVRIPFFTRGTNISVSLKATGVQFILENIRISVDAETVDVFTYDNIL